MQFMWREAVKGLLVGAGIGGLAGLGVCTWIIDEPWLFVGDTILFGALICGVAGFLWGEQFFEWLSDWWHRLI